MMSLWFESGHLECRTTAVPSPPSGEALVRVLRAGICNTDLEIVRGYFTFTGIPGHEFVGRVERGSEALIGKRVVGEINAVCGDCDTCRAGRPSHCERRTVLGILNRHGAFAEYLVLPEANLHVVPGEVSTDAAVFTEPLAAALEIQEQLAIRPENRVLVVGDGKLGLLIAQTLALKGCDLLVMGRHAAKLSLLVSRGIPTTLGNQPQPASFDVSVECTGNAEGFAIARRALRPRGTLVMKSTYRGSLNVDASMIVVDEITLVGSRCGPFDKALRLLAERRVDVEPLIHARYPLAQGEAAFERAAASGVLKVLIDMEPRGTDAT